jgi:hypothetical protein
MELPGTALANTPLAQVLDKDETILWSGRPHPLPFFASGIPILIFGLCWGAFDYFGFIRHMGSSSMNSDMKYTMIPFFAFHLFTLWIALANFIRLPIVYRNTLYALTNRRVLVQCGFWGLSFQSIDYDRIQESTVSVNIIERPLGLGTVRIYSGRTSSRGGALYDSFTGIDHPYDVYKQLKQVTVDIKTDWNYPNAMRPKDNPGYSTRYENR